MSKNVLEIPQNEELKPIWRQQLRVAAYCRVSTIKSACYRMTK